MDKIVMKAHGRVNLIGEHTDYNGGWVLPTTIPQYTEVTLEKRSDSLINIVSSEDPESGGKRSFSYELSQENPTSSWVDYLQGATKLLAEFISPHGKKIHGINVTIHSTIPEGSGLSSSAALEMSFLKAMNELFQLNISAVDLALIGQRIENEFVGARVGIMDQMATSLAQHGEALYLDTLKLTYERVPLPLDLIDVMVINSGVSHKLSATDGGYNERRSQCEEACKLLGIKLLREISLSDLEKCNLPPVLMKRAHHVVSENERVHATVRAIRENNPEEMGKLFIQSHQSMRDDYEVSIPEIDLLVELCLKADGVYGARLTGGGFGGSIVALTKKGLKEKIAEKVIASYQELTGEKGTLLA